MLKLVVALLGLISMLGTVLCRNTQAEGNKAPDEVTRQCVDAVMKNLPNPGEFSEIMMPMRDGVKLATAVFLPKGKGPWPVVLVRTAYSRWAAAPAYSSGLKNTAWGDVAFVCQNLRGGGGSEGAGTFDPESFDNEINDSYDTVEWLAKQSWCDGHVGMLGNSGNGFAAHMAMLANPPHLNAVYTVVCGGNAHLYWFFDNGVVRRTMFDWLQQYRGASVPQWPKPTVRPFDQPAYERLVAAAAATNRVAFISQTGWFDLFLESSLDYFQAFSKNGKVFVFIEPKGHSPLTTAKFPAAAGPPDAKLPSFALLTRGKDKEALAGKTSFICYYLMGDFRTPGAPGNCYKVAHEWPLPHKDVSLYLNADGALTKAAPEQNAASLAYKYDPRDPVPAIGGGYAGSGGGGVTLNSGPDDQRPLRARKDILRFETAPLESPLEITGKLSAELYVSSDVPDTTFMVKVVDIYPDGFEAYVRESAMMARYWNGLNSPAPLKKGQVVRLQLDLWSTAIVINKGHKIAVHVTSSSAPKYEVHPNTYKPVNSFDGVPVATNTIHMDASHPSRIILPVVAPP